MLHELKTWTEYFEATLNGTKRFEVRADDYGFAKGDILCLMEWNSETRQCTGRSTWVKVTYILRNAYGLGIRDGYVVMSTEPMESPLKG